jgi:hypothetical protein
LHAIHSPLALKSRAGMERNAAGIVRHLSLAWSGVCRRPRERCVLVLRLLTLPRGSCCAAHTIRPRTKGRRPPPAGPGASPVLGSARRARSRRRVSATGWQRKVAHHWDLPQRANCACFKWLRR